MSFFHWFHPNKPAAPSPVAPIPPAVRTIAVATQPPVANANVILDDVPARHGGTTNADGYVKWDDVPASLGASHVWIDAPGFLPVSQHVDLPHTNFQIDIRLTPAVKQPSEYSDAELRNFKGNFCGIVIPGLPYKEVLFTPAYTIYDEGWRRRIRAEYKARNYTHFPISLFGGSVYHDVYPDPDESQINVFLKELWDDGLIPVCFVHGDDFSTNPHVDPGLVRIVVAQWEMNGPCENNTDQINKTILHTRELFPSALCYVHFSPLHAAGGEPEADWWVWAKANGIRGLLYEHDRVDVPQAMWDRCVDFLIRFGSGYHGWPMDVDFVLFETGAYQSFWHPESFPEAVCNRFNNDVLSRAPARLDEGGTSFTGSFAGFCNGH